MKAIPAPVAVARIALHILASEPRPLAEIDAPNDLAVRAAIVRAETILDCGELLPYQRTTAHGMILRTLRLRSRYAAG